MCKNLLFKIYCCSLFVLLLSSTVKAQKTVYIPAEWKVSANNIDYNLATRSKESANFVVFWGPLAGNDPVNSSSGTYRFNPQTVLDSFEVIYKKYITDIGVMPEIGNLTKYKTIIVMNETWRTGLFEGWAFGSGYDFVTGAMWVSPTAFRNDQFAMAHEFVHTLQYITPVLFPGKGFNGVIDAGPLWEAHANFMALEMYPNNISATDIAREINYSQYNFSSGRKQYANIYFLQLIKDKFGLDMVNRIWREADNTLKEHPLQVLKRILGYTQDQLNDLLMEHAFKGVKWDYSNKTAITAAENQLNRNRVWKKTVLLDSIGEGHFAVPDYFAPQDFGFDIVRLYPKLKSGCTDSTLYLKFKGHVDAGAQSGWRYGLLSVQTGGTTTYSDIYKDSNGELAYKFPKKSIEYYLVVMGAPDVIHRSVGFDMGFPKIYRFPWEIKLQGFIPEGYQENFRQPAGVAGAPHPNGGGFVASAAKVASTAYVGPNAKVLEGAQVSGNARIEGRAIVRFLAKVSENAVVKDFAIVDGFSDITGNAVIAENAQIYAGTSLKVMGNAVVKGAAQVLSTSLTDNAMAYGNAYLTSSTLSGTIQIGGDAEYGNLICSAGRYLQSPGAVGTTNSVRTICDGLVNHAHNNDVNAVYTPYTDAQIVFSVIEPQCIIESLPVKLTSYNVVLTSGNAVISWKTAEEINNDYYILESSTDGQNFTFIAKIAGKGSSSSYNYTARNVENGYNYYRLTQVNTDGEAEVIGLKYINANLSGQTVSVYPNPIKGSELNIVLPALVQLKTIHVFLYNSNGVKVYDSIIPTENQTINVKFTHQLPDGIYILDIEGVGTKKVLIKN